MEIQTKVIKGQNLLAWLEKRIPTILSCGGKGVCGKCRVRIVEGKNCLCLIPASEELPWKNGSLDGGWLAKP